MLVTCHECHSKYSIADEKIRGRVARVRCRHCATMLEVQGPSASAAPAVSYDDPSDPTTTPVVARRAAVLPREPRRDLFAPTPSSAPPPAASWAPPAIPSGVAARNESSVLFSISALGGSAVKSSAPAAQPAAKLKDDSGLIDLNALMAAPLTPRSVPPIAATEAPVGAFTREVTGSIAKAPKKRGALLGFAAAAAVVLAVVGLQVAARSADREASANIPAPVLAAPPPAAEPVAPPPAAASTLASTTPSDAKPITPSSSDAAPSHARGKHAHASARHASAHASAPAAPPPPADPCHCHGNLMCAMKCSAH